MNLLRSKDVRTNEDAMAMVNRELESVGLALTGSFEVSSNGDRADRGEPDAVVGGWELRRAWSYWMAEGADPMHIPLPAGLGRSIRADGHCDPRRQPVRPVSIFHIDDADGLDRFVRIVTREGGTI